MSKNNDILTGSKDLKTMPYSIPEGYFDSLEAKVLDRIGEEEESRIERGKKRIFPMRLIPYLSAAAVAIIVAVGLTFGLSGMKTAIPEGGLLDSDYIFYYTELIPVTEPESIYYSYNSASEELSDEDIIEYLIESGVDVETLFNSLN